MKTRKYPRRNRIRFFEPPLVINLSFWATSMLGWEQIATTEMESLEDIEWENKVAMAF